MSPRLLEFLKQLKQKAISFRLDSVREESIMVIISVPGQRWEVEFMDDGTIEIEKFLSNGEIFNESELESLFRQFSD